MASTRRRRLVLCFWGILLKALIGKCHYLIIGMESRPSAARCHGFVEDNRCLCAAFGARCLLQAALLISNPELGPAPESVSISEVNASVTTSALWNVPASYGVISRYMSTSVYLKLYSADFAQLVVFMFLLFHQR